MKGEAGELDPAWVEKITDPLTDLVRTIDHGIATPERVTAGKPELGTIALSATWKVEPS